MKKKVKTFDEFADLFKELHIKLEKSRLCDKRRIKDLVNGL